MITLHHLNNSRSTRIIWLLEELQLDYELVSYTRKETKFAPDALKRIHSLGKAPILVDEKNGKKRTIAESGTIIEYILHQYDTAHKLKPVVGSDEWWDYLFWLHFAEGSAMTPLLMSLVFSSVQQKSPKLLKPITKGISAKVNETLIQPNLDRHNELIEQTLSKQTWFAGKKLTGADIQMSFVLEATKARGNIARYPAMKKCLDTIRARPAYQQALKKGGELVLG